MLVFVDESGDAGTKTCKGSSKYFVVAAVWFEDRDEASACDKRIDLIRVEMGLPPTVEFHFSKTSNRIRKYFLEQVVSYQFFYFGIVINKEKLLNPYLKVKESFYKYAVNLLFQNAKPHLKDAIVVIDKSGQKAFRSELARYLKKRMNEKRDDCTVKSIKMQPSHNNNLLQLSDMVCGALAKCYREEPQDEFREIIRLRELDLRVWPD